MARTKSGALPSINKFGSKPVVSRNDDDDEQEEKAEKIRLQQIEERLKQLKDQDVDGKLQNIKEVEHGTVNEIKVLSCCHLFIFMILSFIYILVCFYL